MEKKIKIGLLGLGVVGAELANIIKNNRQRIFEKYGAGIEIAKVYVRDLNKSRDADISELTLTTDAYDILEDDEIDIICECMGGAGTQKTREFVVRAIKNGKSVVMSSKKVLAIHGMEILGLTCRENVQLRYDATVGGGIPVAKILKECFKGEKVKKIVGILNATSNFIYSKMEKEHLSFDEALKLAQKLGYAENDPTEDIGGYDALYKAIVLTMFSMKKWVDIELIKTTPFSNISVLDMKYANEMGYQIKPLVIAENSPKGLVYRIGPCLINANHIAANTFNNYNIVVFEGSNSGILGFYGQGAGSKPTASAMFDDLVSVINLPDENIRAFNNEMYSDIEAVDMVHEYKNNLYWRINVDNNIGRLAAICSILADNAVNIEKVIQKDEIDGNMWVVLLTSRTDSATIDRIVDVFCEKNIKIDTIIPFLGD